MKTEIVWAEVWYFNREDFDAESSPGSGNKMNPDFLRRLCVARFIAGVSFVISKNGGFAVPNVDRGGVPGSSHEKGLGVDIICSASKKRDRILIGLRAAGFTRIGVYDRHIHVDDDLTKPNPRTWWGRSS